MSRKSQLTKQRRNRPVSTEREIVQIITQQLSHYSGPLPQAEQLEQYERICPGYAKELLEMAKKGQDHAQEMEKKSLELHTKFSLNHQKYFGRGQIIGGVLAFSAIIAGTIFCIYGYPKTGASIIGAILTVLGGAFA
jgi:uncharacterized membrane protein